MFSPSRKRKLRSVRNPLEDTVDRPISEVYPVIDTDLARDNIENDLSDADLQDLEHK